MSHRREEWVLGFYAESVGNGGTNRCTRWVTRPLADDPDNAYTPCFGHGSALPSEIASEIDFRAMGSARATMGGLTFKLRASSTVLSAFYTQAPRPRVCDLDAEISSSDTSIQVNRLGAGLTINDLLSKDLLLEREVFRTAGTFTGTGPWTLTGCSRGRLLTRATKHGVEDSDDVSVFFADPPGILLHRELVFFYVLDSGSYADEVVLFRGVIDDVDMDEGLEHVLIMANSLLQLTGEREIANALFKATKHTTNPNDQFQRFVGLGRLPDSHHHASPRYATFNIGGKSAGVASWGRHSNGAGDSGANVSVGNDRRRVTEWLGGSPALTPQELSDIKEIHEFFTTHPAGPPLNSDSDTLSSNVFTLGEQVLTTTEADTRGDPGPNGVDDLGIGQLGCALKSTLIDETATDTVRDRLGELPIQEAVHLGWEGKPVKAMEFIQNLVRPYGCVWAPGDDGKLAPAQMLGYADGTETAIAERDLAPDEPVRPARRLHDPIDQVVGVYDFRPGFGTQERPFNNGVRLRRYPHSRNSVERLEMPGVGSQDATGYEARVLAAELGAYWVQRWHIPIPQYRIVCLPTDDILGIWPGQRVTFTHSQVPKLEGGTRGLTDALCVVTSRAFDLENMVVELTLLHTGAIFTNVGKIGPAATVKALPGGNVITLDQNTFSASLMPGQTDDTFGFSVSSVVKFTTRDRSTVRGTATLNAVTPGAPPSVTVDSMPAGVAIGDLMQLADYDSALAADQSAFVWWADDLNTLGAGGAAGKEWTS